MKQKFILLVFCFCTSIGLLVHGQKHDVLLTSGNISSNAQGFLSWSVGEVITEAHFDDSGYLSQGFNQGFLNSPVVINKIENMKVKDIHIYPNPLNDVLYIETTGKPSHFNVINSHGITINTGVLNDSLTEISFSGCPTGIYFIQIENNKTYKIIKH